MTGKQHDGAAANRTSVRLDKWLWAARFYRTRTLAAQAIAAGQVRVDGERVKPAHTVRAASRVAVRKQEVTYDVEVTGVSEQRGSAGMAALLYRETPESIAAREAAIEKRRASRSTPAMGRPTKRDRRKLEDFLNEP